MEDHVLELKEITKTFPGVKALDRMQFQLRRGSIHALIGENGAGKSTLMKVISGIYTPDSGQILLDGAQIHVTSPLDAERKGISIVHQELSVFNTSSVAENIFTIHAPKNQLGMIDYKRMYRDARQILDQYGFQDVGEKATMRNLSVGRQQIVEILRAVKQNAKVLILDEPTSALTEKETEVLMQIMRTLHDGGVSIIYISHRLEEIFQICDTVTIMRDGQYIKTLQVSQTSKEELVKYMVGRDVVYQYGAGTSQIGEEVLRLENVCYKNYVKDVSLCLHAGEVLGLAGLEGAGRTELLECIFGVHRPESGKLYLDGKEVHIHSTGSAKRQKLAYITKDRKNKGLFLRMSIADNMLAANVDRLTRHGFMQFREGRQDAAEYREKFEIKTPDVNKLVKQLSEQEVQLLQTEQCEHVGREHDERIFGQAENGGDRIESEHHVGGADGQEHDEHRGPMLHTVLDSTQLFAVVFIGDLDDLAQCVNQRVLMVFLVLVSPGDEFDGRDDEERAE